MFRRIASPSRQPIPDLARLEAEHGALPSDFEARAYLELNDDVARAVTGEREASAHYLIHGRSEGRRYRSRLIIALDGHDGSGKSTLAGVIAGRVGGRVVKPFGGAFGQYMLWLSGQRRYDLLSHVARAELRKAIAAEPGEHPLVVDRHALTMGVLLSRSWRADWRPLPHSVLCYADATTVVERLGKRGEHVGREDKHARAIQRFRALAEEYGVPFVGTRHRDPEEAADEALRAMGLTPRGAAA